MEPKRDSGRRSPVTNLPTPTRGSRRDTASNGGSRGSSNALEDVMRRKGVDEAWTALEEMQKSGAATDKFTISRMLMKTVGDGRCRLNPSRVYRGIDLVERFIEQQPKDVDEVLFNALLDTCCRLKDLNRLEATVQRMRELKVQPSPVTLGILVKTYGQAGDLQKVLQVWSEMEKQRGQANAVTYGCMIDACVKCGHLEKAVEIFKGMKKEKKHKNTILYTTLIKGYGLEKDLQHALELFREMAHEGVPYNTITYNSVIDACIKCGDVASAETLLHEMTAPESTLEPDLISYSTLLKGYCHAGELDKALHVAETIKAKGLRCDELVYNTLMDGCVKANDITAGVGLFEEMVHNGMKPSAITHSILARLYQRAGYDEEANEAVAQLYQHHGIERPSGGERGKGHGRRTWGDQGARSPAGSASGRSSAHPSPWGTPNHIGFQRDSDSASVWSSCSWGETPNLPVFDGQEHSAPSTPCSGSPPCGSPMHPGMGQQGGMPSILGSGGSYGTRGPIASQQSPSGIEQHSPAMFAMHSSTPTLSQTMPAGCPPQAAPVPPWPFQCVGAAPPMPMQQGGGEPQVPMCYTPQMMQVVQTAPFPMPLSPPHDIAYCVTTPSGGQGHTGQAFFESWPTDGREAMGMPFGQDVTQGPFYH
eukprot:gnl/TRDRNA2_/TRDRNA2_59512_c0_seq1.p1 gnl/TRDRNA2_/TRDRNA2_59512_c0~~gnl/TRDRNA2_/TRDRNA2_59512_c0_seq1.p1  ORF type:complete len:706 (+),score=148.84 gnl/TRDRNA2_/TRDRNA2_59512_c0_seq1:172-2118(+)